MKRTISKLVAMLLLSFISIQLSYAGNVWDGKTVASGFYGGSGTKSNPYTIYTASQFVYFYKQLANGQTYSGKYISIMNDIEISTNGSYFDMTTLKVEGVEIEFKGFLNGNDHKLGVSGGYASSSKYLFGMVFGQIYNLWLTKSSIFAKLVAGGEIYNCYFAQPCQRYIYMDGGTLANCISGSDSYQETGKYSQASGFLGTNGSGNVFNCNFDGCVYKGYGGGQASNYGGSNCVTECIGTLTNDEHNQWVSNHSTSTKTYKSWPLTFSPTFPSYNVNLTYVDPSGFTNYTVQTKAANVECSLPVPSGFESEFLGWEYNGVVVTKLTPEDNVTLTARWNHAITRQPTVENLSFDIQDKARASFQWYKYAGKVVNYAQKNSSFSIEALSDNTTLSFDYSVYSSSGGYSSDGFSGYVQIDGTSVIHAWGGDDEFGTYSVSLSKGMHTISLSHATLDNVVVKYPGSIVSGGTTCELPYTAVKPATGVYRCRVQYGSEVIETDYIDTSTLFELEGNIYCPTSETTVALLKANTSLKVCTIPESVTYNEVSYKVSSISDYAFRGCTSLQSIISMTQTPLNVKSETFTNVPSSLIVYVPSTKVATYKYASVWKNYTITAKDSYSAKLYNGVSTSTDVTINLPNKPSGATASNALMFIHQDVTLTTGADKLFENVAYKQNNAWVAEKVTLTDAQPVYIPDNVTVKELSYAREFAHNGWQALYLPFSMSYEEWADKADVAYISVVHQYDDDRDGIADRTVLEFITQKRGSIKANTPYLIKPKNAGETVFKSMEAKTLIATSADGTIDCRTTTHEYVLTGCYQPITTLYSLGAYALKDGRFAQAADNSVTLSPFRIYLTIAPRDNGYGTRASSITRAGSADNLARSIYISVDGNMLYSTSVDLLLGDEESGILYDLNGNIISNSNKGFLIKNGKKLIVR